MKNLAHSKHSKFLIIINFFLITRNPAIDSPNLFPYITSYLNAKYQVRRNKANLTCESQGKRKQYTILLESTLPELGRTDTDRFDSL